MSISSAATPQPSSAGASPSSHSGVQPQSPAGPTPVSTRTVVPPLRIRYEVHEMRHCEPAKSPG